MLPHYPTEELIMPSHVSTEKPAMSLHDPITEPAMLSHEPVPEPMDDSAKPTHRRAEKRCGDVALFDSLHEGVVAHTRHRKN